MMLSPGLAAVIIAAAWFCVFVVIHVAGWRAGHGNARWLVISYGSSVLAMLISVISSTDRSDPMAALAAVLLALMTSACLFVLYVPAVYTVLTSLSVQTLVMLRRAGGALPEAELYAHFAGRGIVDGRLATLAASGYLVADDGRFRLTSRGRILATIFAFVKEFWKLGAGG
ncbi:MAG: hypothetical protein ACJ8D9_07710 [Xanthobacteraceae bacterium]|jgi:hypothetical protein